MKLRYSTYFIALTAINLFLVVAMIFNVVHQQRKESAALSETKLLVRKLRLTDLCLSTEARYTRHPAMADRHAAFQEHPTALDHFPSGSLMPPVSHLWRQHD